MGDHRSLMYLRNVMLAEWIRKSIRIHEAITAGREDTHLSQRDLCILGQNEVR